MKYNASQIPSTLILMLLVSLSALGSDFKWGKISDRERELEVCSYEEDAKAIVLFDIGKMAVVGGGQWVLGRHRRIKILKKEGVQESSDMAFVYFAENDIEDIISIKAQTINENEKIKVSKSQIHTIELNDKLKEVRISFPNVKVGSILEVSYRFVSRSMMFLDAWNFQSEYPTLHSELHAQIQQGLNYSVKLNGENLIKKFGHLVTNLWVMKDLKSLKDEKFVFNKDDFSERIQFQLESYYSYGNGQKGTSNGLITVLKTWEALVKDDDIRIWKRKYIGKKVQSSKIIDQLDLGDKTDIEKLKSIYNYVRKNYQWNNEYRIRPNSNFNKFAINKKGNSADINLFLTELLNSAGIECQPAFISTRSHGLIFKAYPFLSQFNHLISIARINNKSYFLDAVNPNRPYYMMSSEDYNKEAFILDDENPRWIKLPTPKPYEQVVSVKVDYSQAPLITFEVDVKYKGYALMNKLAAKENKMKNSLIAKLQNHLELNLDSVSLTTDELSIREKFMFSGSIDPSEMRYLPAFWHTTFSENPFLNEKRYYPVQFNHPYKIQYISNFILPENLQVIDLPLKSAAKLPSNLGMYIFTFRQSGNNVYVSSLVELSKSDYPVSTYSQLKEFFGRVIGKQNEQLVLGAK